MRGVLIRPFLDALPRRDGAKSQISNPKSQQNPKSQITTTGEPQGESPAPTFAVEVRNKTFLKPALLDALRDRSTALVLNDHPWVPRPDEWLAIPGVFTAPYVPIRLLGDRYAIEKVTKTWGETVIDKRKVLEGWAKIVKAALAAGRSVTAFANNHFAGHAPASIEGLAEAVQGTKGWP